MHLNPIKLTYTIPYKYKTFWSWVLPQSICTWYEFWIRCTYRFLYSLKLKLKFEILFRREMKRISEKKIYIFSLWLYIIFQTLFGITRYIYNILSGNKKTKMKTWIIKKKKKIDVRGTMFVDFLYKNKNKRNHVFFFSFLLVQVKVTKEPLFQLLKFYQIFFRHLYVVTSCFFIQYSTVSVTFSFSLSNFLWNIFIVPRE